MMKAKEKNKQIKEKKKEEKPAITSL